ncbi:MAG: YfhO family protein [Anaerolineae bacterium]|nr:YfhO family protein [Anaerolineae bacterium]
MNAHANAPSTGAGVRRADVLACVLLAALWALFFWRVLTPNPADQVALEEGDFSGQFYAFSAYQARRLLAGEIPLWNPYANGGHPFLADTQAAAFYPPRLVFIYLSSLFGGWSYHALQLEAAAHYLLASLLMYAFIRRVTGRPFAGIVAALTFTYSGYLTGYPILQLAILEAAVWLPLVLLGLHEATRHARPGWLCVVLAGVALGLCLLAGHPQTALFTLYLSLAYLAYRVWAQCRRAPEVHRYRACAYDFTRAAALMGAVGFALAAVQLLPGWEYLQRTTRPGMAFDVKAGGFPFQDPAQLLVSDLVSHWSPLYLGLAGLALAVFALWRRYPGAGFWGVAAASGLAYSFGGHTIVYHIAYNLLPGASLFRGQERAAFVVAFSLAAAAGLGAAACADWTAGDQAFARRFWRALVGVAALTWVVTAALFVLWRGPDAATYLVSLEPVAFAALLAALTLGVFWWRFRDAPHAQDARPLPGLRAAPWQVALVALVVFDLFSVNIGRNFEASPPGARPRLSSLVGAALADADRPFRVDGREGLGENYGTLVGLQDINGTSPLRLQQHDALLNLPEADRWRLLGVRYVFSAREALPAPSEIVARDGDRYLHRLTDANPMAWLSTDLGAPIGSAEGTAIIASYAPERITLEVNAPADAYLILSEHDYPGWTATADGDRIAIERTALGLRAVRLTAGQHTVEMVYAPASFTWGAVLTGAALLAVVAATLWSWVRARRAARRESEVGDARP